MKIQQNCLIVFGVYPYLCLCIFIYGFQKGSLYVLIVSYFWFLVFFPLIEHLFFIQIFLQRFIICSFHWKRKVWPIDFPIHVPLFNYNLICTRTHHFYLNYSPFHTSFNFFALEFIEALYMTKGWLPYLNPLNFTFASPKNIVVFH